ncbi:MAG: filamentous hemagglutinin N-terminal domain-containing protein [Cyanobacteria bacterium P01_F01_bin.150]
MNLLLPPCHFLKADIRWQCLTFIVSLSSQCFLFISTAWSQVIPDLTLGSESSQVSSIDARTNQIDRGAQRGSNLFHSFESFNIGKNQVLHFSVPRGVNRIFSRVTGNDVSNIFGTLRIVDDADLFFINPNGIIFGRNSQLDINGSFIASTADAINFPNTGLFSATSPNESVLLSVNPNAFLFEQSSEVTSSRGALIHRAILNSTTVPGGETLGLLGGSITIRGRESEARSMLNVLNGRIELGSVQDGSTVELLINDKEQYQFQYDDALISGFNDIQLNNARVQVENGGSIQVTGENIELSNRSFISANVSSNVVRADVGLISVMAQETMQLDGASNISSQLFSPQSLSYGTNVEVTAKTVEVNAGSEISSYVNSEGIGGTVSVNAQDIVVSGVSVFSGQFGRSSIVSELQKNSGGQAGPLEITTGNLLIADGGRVATTMIGQGVGGNLSIQATGTIEIQDALLASDAARNTRSGQAGDLTIETDRLLVSNEGLISTSLIDAQSASNANVGLLTIQANEIQITGIGRDIENWDQLLGQNSSPLRLTGILSETNPGNAGDAGDINITVSGPLVIRNGGGIATTAQAFNNAVVAGEGGSIQISAESLSLDGGNLLTGTSVTDSGNLTLNIDDFLFLTNSSVISTNAGQLESGGSGGDITIIMPDGIMFARPQSNSDISANAFEEEGGPVNIIAQVVIGFIPRSRNNLIQALDTSNPIGLNARDIQSNDITAISQANPDLSSEILITTNSDPGRAEELPSGLTDTSNQIDQTVCRATQGSEFLVTGQGGVLPSPREQFRSEDLWEDWRLMDITEGPSELPLLSSTLPIEEQSEDGTEMAILLQPRQISASTPQHPNTPTNRSDSLMGYAVANPSYEQTPPLPYSPTSPPILEAQSWQTTPNGDIILVADTSPTNASANIPNTIPRFTACQSHIPSPGDSAS